MNLCKDCEHFRRAGPNSNGNDKCNHPNAVRIEPVRGHVSMPLCSKERLPGNDCGPQAKRFEPRKRLWSWK